MKRFATTLAAFDLNWSFTIDYQPSGSQKKHCFFFKYLQAIFEFSREICNL